MQVKTHLKAGQIVGDINITQDNTSTVNVTQSNTSTVSSPAGGGRYTLIDGGGTTMQVKTHLKAGQIVGDINITQGNTSTVHVNQTNETSVAGGGRYTLIDGGGTTMQVKTHLKAGQIVGNITIGQTNTSEATVTQSNSSSVVG